MTQHIEEARKLAKDYAVSRLEAVAEKMIADALAAAEERGRIEERERIVERLWAAHGDEHSKLGVVLSWPREDEIAVNWQGGKVNGLATAIQITKEPTP